VAIEAPAGSLVIFEARVWHKTGANRSKDQTRAGIFGWYTKPIYRPQENWFLSLKPEIHQFASEDMKVLLGYTGFGLGLKNGVAPG
jgi:ectoine hydroxylase-related dioxygenase (phytanoyl-CoA dioxygenase family)